MKKKKNNFDSPRQAAELRQKAEEIARANAIQSPGDLSLEEIQKTVYELHIHQIQLEMQNEELRRAQAELETSRKRYFDLAPIGYLSLSEQGSILEANLTVATLLGVPRGTLVNHPFSRFVLPEDHGIFSRHSKSLFATRAPQVFELRLKKKDAAPFWARVVMSVALDADGAPVCLAVVSDITGQKRTEKALVEAEANRVASLYTRSLIETSLDPLVTISPDGKVTDVNAATEVVTGYPRDELIGTDFADYFTDPMAARAGYRQAFQAGSVCDYALEIRHREGHLTQVLYNASVYRDESGKVAGVFAAARDISDRKRAEDALRKSQELFSLFMRYSPIFIYIKQVSPTESRVLQASDNFQQMIGISGQAMIGRTMAELFPAELAAKISADDWAVVANSEVLELDEDFNSRNYTTIKFPIVHGGETLLGGYTIDITERKRSEDALRESEARMNFALQNSLIGAWEMNLDSHNTQRTLLHDQIYGYPTLLPRWTYEMFLEHVLPEDRPEVDRIFREATARKADWSFEFRIRRPDGEVRWVYAAGGHLQNREGDTARVSGIVQDITKRKSMEEKLAASVKEIERIAYHDSLTDLPNRLLVTDRLNQALAQADRLNQSLAVCYLDLDGFKPVNDTHGHAAGDKLLIEIARRLQASVRANDTVGRLGGDEFVLLLTGLESAEEYQTALERVIAAISQPVALDATHEATVTCSIGIALFPQDATSPDTLLRYADQAMYAAKQNGRDRYHFFDSHLERRMEARVEMLQRIRQGLADGEFCLYFQPKVDFARKALAGVEALIRWQHPVLGLLEPAEFLPAVENDCLALAMGDWVIRDALRQMQTWRRGGVDLQVSVNLFARQLQQPDFVAGLRQMLAEYPDVPPGQLQLEITEFAALPELPSVEQIITDCRQLGIGFSIDDFGMGYTSLVYLRHLSATELKIDKSFVRDMLTNHEDQAIVEGIIALAHAFQRSSIAEGVETTEQVHRLLEFGCNVMQGYRIAHPMPSGKIVEWVRGFQPDRLLR
jgi:diguanylate cyclase (GGDEF)-like protein/PAS domain S-box-containing protein